MTSKSRLQNNKNKKQSLTKKPEAPSVSQKTGTSSHLLYEVVSFLTLFAGFLLFLSFFGVLWRAGDFLNDICSQVFGSFRYFAALWLVGWAYVRFRFVLRPFTGAQIFGVFLFICSSSGLFHAFVPLQNSMAIALRGEYGGILWFFFAYPLIWLFGPVGAVLLLLVFWIVSLLFLSQKTFFELLSLCRTILSHPAERSAPQSEPVRQIESRVAPAAIDRPSVKKEIAPRSEVVNKTAQDIIIKQFTAQTDDKKSGSSTGKSLSLKKAEHFDIQSPAFRRENESWVFPPLDIIKPTVSVSKVSDDDLRAQAEAIKKKLAEFSLPVLMNDVHVGPTVMQFTMRPEPWVKLSQLKNLWPDLAMALKAKSLRIEAPIPETDLVGIEIPSLVRVPVGMREILQTPEFTEHKGNLRLVMGRNTSGKPIVIDLCATPHMLVAGNTGSGKSVFINTLLVSLLYQHSPNTLRLILVDPKQVELGAYEKVPHLLTPVIGGDTEKTAEKTMKALKWAVAEMTRRYSQLREKKVRDIKEYNAAVETEERFPYIVIVIDEMAELMAVARKDVEQLIQRIAQMARAVGIHLVLATQRPSVDVITGLIKANVPTRVAFTVASQVDSKTIIDVAGAEELLGKGDMLFLMNGEVSAQRIQAPFVSTDEVNSLVYELKMKNPASLTDYDVFEDADENKAIETVYIPWYEEKKRSDNMWDDDLYEEAVKVVVQQQKASTTMLQRYLWVGYARAAKLIDMLEQAGVVGPADGAKPRKVFWKGAEDGEATDTVE